MAVPLSGLRNQEWMNRSARERAFARFAGAGFFVSMGFNALLLVVGVYLASLPRETAVVVAQQRDGSYQPYAQNVTPNQAGITMLLANWISAWRVSSTDPKALSSRQTAALLGESDDVLRQVKDYEQSVADGGWKVVPSVRPPSCVAYDCEVDWDEVATSSTERVQRSMRAYVTVAFDEKDVNLRNDPITNPYGMYIRTLRVAEIGKK